MEVYLDWDMIENFVNEVFMANGVPKADAKICTDVLLDADKRGMDTHGLNRLKPIYIDRIKEGIQSAQTDWEIIKETPTTAVMDAHDGMGQVASYHATNIAIKKAKEYGMGMVAVRNSTHYGTAGYYTEMAAAEGCIGLSGTNARPSIAPTFSVQNKLGTNPLSFAFPTDEEFPFSLDAATSIIQRGEVELRDRQGRDTPEGTVIGSDGSAMTDSPKILQALLDGEAAFAPLGGIGEELSGYKGYGYATIVEVLSAALQQGNFLSMLSGLDKDGNKIKYHLGHFFLAIDTEAFMGLESFKETAGDILRELRAAKVAPGEERIYTAGEKEYLTWMERKETGLAVNESVQKELVELRDAANLDDFIFPFESEE
ncbi:MAG: Ldh family oxidoreductase [Atopostipes suicloacalis]|nr:Ldh family oxidoreductase [Atopostipes sp.]MDN6731396.1 Ldh family oxidoreductase [Atopostipes suicloacalis]